LGSGESAQQESRMSEDAVLERSKRMLDDFLFLSLRFRRDALYKYSVM
jgi:hypothetical protein